MDHPKSRLQQIEWAFGAHFLSDIRFASKEKDLEVVRDRILVECDINNVDQDRGHDVRLVSEIIGWADSNAPQMISKFVQERIQLSDAEIS